MNLNDKECAAVQLQEPINGCSNDCGCPYNLKIEGLRKLRLHHWICALQIAPHIERLELVSNVGIKFSRIERREANLAHLKMCKSRHLNFVQLLNDFFEIGDTAERDASK